MLLDVINEPPDAGFVAKVELVAFVAFVAFVAEVALVAVAALPEIEIPQVPDAPVPVGAGTSVPMVNPKFVLALAAVVAPVPPLATAKVPVRFAA